MKTENVIPFDLIRAIEQPTKSTSTSIYPAPTNITVESVYNLTRWWITDIEANGYADRFYSVVGPVFMLDDKAVEIKSRRADSFKEITEEFNRILKETNEKIFILSLIATKVVDPVTFAIKEKFVVRYASEETK